MRFKNNKHLPMDVYSQFDSQYRLVQVFAALRQSAAGDT